MKTLVLKPAEVTPQWWVVDATDKVLGRLAAAVAPILIGKHQPNYTPHVASGDFVIVVNADKVKLTGKKWEQKTYQRYSGYPSGQTTITAAELKAKKPELVVKHAIRRMLPKNKLGKVILSRLKIYAGPAHPHQAQQPKDLNVGKQGG